MDPGRRRPSWWWRIIGPSLSMGVRRRRTAGVGRDQGHGVAVVARVRVERVLGVAEDAVAEVPGPVGDRAVGRIRDRRGVGEAVRLAVLGERERRRWPGARRW